MDIDLPLDDDSSNKPSSSKKSYPVQICLTDTYMADGGQGNYKISGSILFGIWHKDSTLNVWLVQAKDLAIDPERNLPPDPFIQVHLLPDKKKWKTRVKKETTDPGYYESVKIDLLEHEIQGRVIIIDVWNWDTFGRHLFLGEINLSLNQVNLNKEEVNWHDLTNRACKPKRVKCGQLKFSILYAVDGEGSLLVYIENCINMNIKKRKKKSIFVRALLLPKQNECSITQIIENTSEPKWNEGFEFDNVTFEELQNHYVLELSVWNYDGIETSEFIGCIRLGSLPKKTETNSWMDSDEEEFYIWMNMLTHPGKWIESCLELRSSIANRLLTCPESIDYSPNHNQEVEVDSSSLEKPTSAEETTDISSSEEESVYHHTLSERLLIRLNYEDSVLDVHIVRADNLAPVLAEGYSDPYVKVYLLQNRMKIFKWKSNIVKKTLNPLFNDNIQILHRKVHRSDLCLGKTLIPLSKYKQHQQLRWYYLNKREAAKNEEDSSTSASTPDAGILQLSLKFEELGCSQGNINGNLHVYITSARGLMHRSEQYTSYCFIKVSLMPATNCFEQTKKILNNTKPVWNEDVTIKNLTLEKLTTQHCLKIEVMDEHFVVTCIGTLHLALHTRQYKGCKLLRSNRLETSHWELLLSNPCEWVECCHILRPNWKIVDDLLGNYEHSMQNKTGRGHLVISLMYKRTTKSLRVKGDFHVKIHEGQQLSCDVKDGICAKCEIYPHVHGDWIERSTRTIAETANPAWEEEFVFNNQSLDDLHSKRVLDISLYSSSSESTPTFFGRICLGTQPRNSSSEEIRHWEAVFANYGKWVEDIHALKL